MRQAARFCWWCRCAVGRPWPGQALFGFTASGEVGGVRLAKSLGPAKHLVTACLSIIHLRLLWLWFLLLLSLQKKLFLLGCQLDCARDDLAKINFNGFRNPQQGIQRGISQISLHEADDGVGQAGALSDHVHGKTTLLPFFAQEANDIRGDGFPVAVSGHGEVIANRAVDNECDWSHSPAVTQRIVPNAGRAFGKPRTKMKTTIPFLRILGINVVVFLSSLPHASAQEITKDDLGEIPAPPPLNLPLIAPERVPDGGNFYSAAHDWPPLPFNPLATNLNVPVYSLGAAMGKKANAPFYLFDDRAVVAAEELALAAAEADFKAKGLSRTEPPEPPSAARGVVPTGMDLLLDIEDATNGIVSLTIYNPDAMTNNPVWDVWTATQFSGNPDNWTWIARTEPGQTNLLVAMPSETEAYFRLGATNNDVDADGILDSWMSQHFGHVTAWASDHTRATDDYDGDGVNNLAEYNASSDPNDVRFVVGFPDSYTSNTSPTGTAEVRKGSPSWIVSLVDTNPASFTGSQLAALPWQPCPVGTQSGSEMTFPASLSVDGWHTVWVGMAGRAPNSKVFWNSFQLKLDRTAPVVHLLNPTNSTATVPYSLVQIQGYTDERLDRISYDLSSTSQSATNVVAYVTSATGTRTDFQAYDVNLTPGEVNTLTLHVWDRAGNRTDTTLTLQVDTNTPALTNSGISWPAEGTLIAGDTCSVIGNAGDPGATVTASITDAQGNESIVAGRVDRSGNYSIQDVPIHTGENILSVMLTDGQGRSVTNSLTVQRAAYSIEPTVGDLRRFKTTVTGNIAKIGNVPDIQSIAVNGQAASPTGNPIQGWSATNISVDATAPLFRVTVVATPTSGASVELVREYEKPAFVRIDSFSEEDYYDAVLGCDTAPITFESFSLGSWKEGASTTATDTVGGSGYSATTTFQLPADRFLPDDAWLFKADPNHAVPWTLDTPSLPISFHGVDSFGAEKDMSRTTNTFVGVFCSGVGGGNSNNPYSTSIIGYVNLAGMRAPAVTSSHRDVDLMIVQRESVDGQEIDSGRAYRRKVRDTSLILETGGQPGEQRLIELALKLFTVDGADYALPWGSSLEASPVGVNLGQLDGVTDALGKLVVLVPAASRIVITPKLVGEILRRVTAVESISGGQFAWADMTVAPTPATVQLWDENVRVYNWPTNQNIGETNIAWIQAHSAPSNAPTMPRLELRVDGLSEGITFQAKLDVQYQRGNGARTNRNQVEDTVMVPANGGFQTVTNDTVWRIWPAYTNLPFFGGDSTVTFQMMNGGSPSGPSQTIRFRIGGRNPEPARARAYIESLPNAGPTNSLWFAYALAKHETANVNNYKTNNHTRYNHFLQLPANPRDVGRPTWGSKDGPGKPGGYGLFQVTGNVTSPTNDIPRQQLWNWQSNAIAGIAILQNKYLGAAQQMAVRRQECLDEMGAALAVPDHTVPRAADDLRSTMLGDATDGTAPNPRYTFGESNITTAVAIKRFNGALPIAPGSTTGTGDYCVWKNQTTNSPGRWEFRRWAVREGQPVHVSYVDLVIGEIE